LVKYRYHTEELAGILFDVKGRMASPLAVPAPHPPHPFSPRYAPCPSKLALECHWVSLTYQPQADKCICSSLPHPILDCLLKDKYPEACDEDAGTGLSLLCLFNSGCRTERAKVNMGGAGLNRRTNWRFLYCHRPTYARLRDRFREQCITISIPDILSTFAILVSINSLCQVCMSRWLEARLPPQPSPILSMGPTGTSAFSAPKYLRVLDNARHVCTGDLANDECVLPRFALPCLAYENISQLAERQSGSLSICVVPRP
jgi:hypothetical protein